MNKAMGQVDQVTQRTASAAEELSSTAEGLAAQAEALQQLMAFFRVAGQGEKPGARPAAPALAGHPAPAPAAPPRPTPVPAMPAATAPAGGGNGPAPRVAVPEDRDFTRF
jgi:methyl-accepting chemotaxis protein